MAPNVGVKQTTYRFWSLVSPQLWSLAYPRPSSFRANPVHVRRQFINDVSFKKVIDSWFVCPSFRKAFPFMRNARGTGRVNARVKDEDWTRVQQRRCNKCGWDAVRGVSRRAETYVGQAFPNRQRFRPIRLTCTCLSKFFHLLFLWHVRSIFAFKKR